MARSWKQSIGSRLDKDLEDIYRSYDVIGDIIVVKVPRNLEQKRDEIGRLLLEQSRRARLVLRIAGKTTEDTRIRSVEAIAGSGPTLTTHREYGAVYVVDVGKAFFTPRLSYERWRVAEQVRDDERIVNMFAGVGCYSILIACRKRASVYSIDSNREAIRCMKLGIASNRLVGNVLPILGDARRVCSKVKGVNRVILPLPAKADQFLEIAAQTLGQEGIIHHYRESVGNRRECLSRSLNDLERRLAGVEEGNFEVVQSRIVRSIGPRKWHVAHDIAFRRK